MPRRIGRDTSIIPLMLGPVGIGIPKWIVLVLLYFAVVLGLGWWDQWSLVNIAGAIGPGVIGVIDLALRLRLTHYEWINSVGGRMTCKASIVDRLTLCECGWYLPILNLPLPLWLVGTGLSVAFLRSWGLT